MEFEQKNFQYWRGEERAEAIGVVITVPKEHMELLDVIRVTFIDRVFTENKKE